MRGGWARCLIAAAVMAAPARAQEIRHDETPPECASASSEASYLACLNATEPDSGFHWLSLMHLGMLAMARQDVAGAVAYFDRARARPGGDSEMFTRPRLHAYRATAYRQVGRNEDALAEARVALSLLRRTREIPDAAWAMFDDTPINNEVAYAAILPILREGNDPDFASAREAYLAMPATNWASLSIRAGAMESIDDLEAALRFSEGAMRRRPDHPMILNNHCYILVRLGRAAEALPHCERAATLMPNSAAIRHSYASALAAMGRCPEAAAQNAEAARLDSVSVRREPVCRPL